MKDLILDSHKRIKKSLVNLDALKKALTLKNPEVWKARYMGFTGEDLPSNLFLYKDSEDYLIIPREFDIAPFLVSELVEIEDSTIVGEEVFFESNIRLRNDEQKNSVAALLTGSGVLCLPCGGGKTCCALEAVARMGKRTLVLVHTKMLMKQWSLRIKEFFDEEVGLVGGGNCDWKDKKIVIGMTQTIVKNNLPKEFYNNFGIVIADETHRHSADQWQQAIQKFPAKVRWGLTATPKRADKLECIFHWHIGKILYEGKPDRLEPKVHFVPTNWFVNVNGTYYKFWGTNRPSLVKIINQMVKDADRNNLILKYLIDAAKAGRKILLLTDRVNHAKDLKVLFDKNDLEVKTSLLLGEMSEEEREEAREAAVIFATQHIASEGLDIKELDTLFIATPFGGSNRAVQSVGRILRVVSGKKEPMVIDFEDHKITYLKNLARKRKEAYKELVR